MERDEILNKAQQKKVYVGEMEKQKLSKSMVISLIATAVIAVAFIIVEFTLGHKTAGFAISAVCYGWASIFYFCQYFVAKRPWQVLIGAVLDGLAFAASLTFYILFCVGVL